MGDDRPALDRTVRWQAWDGDGLEHCRIRQTDAGILAEAVVIGGRGGTPYGLTYRVLCDQDWRVREVDVAIAGGAALSLRADGNGHWFDGEGQLLSALEGCIDVDIAATPFTNSLPIRRLKLGESEAADIRVAYVPLPSLEPEAVAQRYTRRGGNLYLYEGLFRNFTAELEIDADRLVIDYPETFRRLANFALTAPAPAAG